MIGLAPSCRSRSSQMFAPTHRCSLINSRACQGVPRLIHWAMLGPFTDRSSEGTVQGPTILVSVASRNPIWRMGHRGNTNHLPPAPQGTHYSASNKYMPVLPYRPSFCPYYSMGGSVSRVGREGDGIYGHALLFLWASPP